MIEVKILADSINPAGFRITSWLLKYPRFIHSEFMTHRVFSRNAASSRAIPFQKMVASIQESPAQPERWALEHKGMTALSELSGVEYIAAMNEWSDACESAIDHATHCSQYGLAKSLCNRLIEPWSHITVLATATEHGNFFALRAHPDAMPELQVLAYRMLGQYLKSDPAWIEWGNWHIPKFSGMEGGPDYGIAGENGIKIATARCARLSYLTHDGEHNPDKDIEMHDRLLAAGHMSPFEHCAKAQDFYTAHERSNFDRPGAPSGWLQYRKQFENESRTASDLELEAIMNTKPDWIGL